MHACMHAWGVNQEKVAHIQNTHCMTSCPRHDHPGSRGPVARLLVQAGAQIEASQRRGRVRRSIVWPVGEERVMHALGPIYSYWSIYRAWTMHGYVILSEAVSARGSVPFRRFSNNWERAP